MAMQIAGKRAQKSLKFKDSCRDHVHRGGEHREAREWRERTLRSNMKTDKRARKAELRPLQRLRQSFRPRSPSNL